MDKVLIISYYYPPSSFVGGERTAYWARNLKKHGISPILLTRKWNTDQKDLFDKIENNTVEIYKNNDHEVHYIPVNNKWKIYFSKKPYLTIFRKALVFLELLFGRLHIISSPYKPFYDYASELLKKDRTIKGVIVSGGPFEMFQVGSYLKKKLSIKWIPDYRDEWNSHQNNNSQINRLLLPLDKHSELKWTANADYFISVSPQRVENIKNLINIKGHVVMNGYEAYKPLPNNTEKSIFKIVYAGTIYESQPIEIFIDSIHSIFSSNKFPDQKIEILFIGTEINVFGHEKLKRITRKKACFKFLSRMNKQELKKEMATADLLLSTSFKNTKGWYPVKLFEYYATGKPILLVPSDEDVMHSFITNTNSGYICEDVSSCINTIEELLINKNNGVVLEMNHNKEYAAKFSRAIQTEILSNLLKETFK